MSLVNEASLRRQVRLAPDDSSQDSALLDCLAAAVSVFEHRTHRRLVEDSSVQTSAQNCLVVDGGVKMALLLLVTHFFEHRGDADVPLPVAFERLANPYRWRDL